MNKYVAGALAIFAGVVVWNVIDEDPAGSGEAVNDGANGILDAFESMSEFVTSIDLPEIIDRVIPDAQGPQLTEISDTWFTEVEAGAVSYEAPVRSHSLADDFGIARNTLRPTSPTY